MTTSIQAPISLYRQALWALAWVSLFGVAVVPMIAAEYDPKIPSPQTVLGYALGERVTNYHGMESYLSALAEASPRVQYGSYGNDDEGRQLRYAIVSSEENLGRLESIRAATSRLTDPRSLTEDSTATLIADTPTVIWLNYSTDGNETAGLESALLMAYHLAAETSSETARLLQGTVVIITPIMNPSSHERWAAWSNSFAAGPAGNPDPRAMEHNPPWGVLTNNNHYLVDLNRESFWASQTESAALRDFFYQWNPAVFVDHHGEYDDFTGPGYEEPLNPLITGAQRRWLDRFGKSIGDRFGGLGWAYSPWETGSFYPGFWESFGSLNGAIGFTYETMGGGSRGLRYRREDGSLATLELAARQHFEASLAVLETAVAARRELLQDYLDYWRSAPGVAASAPERVFVVDPRKDPVQSSLLLEILTANRIEVYRAAADVEARSVYDYFGRRWGEKTFPSGTFWIPVDQPRVRLLLTLMRQDFRLPEVTLQAAEIFRQNREKAGFTNPKISSTTYLFYDVTAWSLPLTFDVSAYWVEQTPAADLEPVESLEQSVSLADLEEARYGYLFSGDGIAASEMLVELLQEDLVLNVAYDDFTIEGRRFPRGSVLVRRDRNPDVDVRTVLDSVARKYGVQVEPIDATYSEEGPSMGSDRMVYVRRPKIAVLAGDPVSTRSFGDLWYTLERLYRLEFTAAYQQQLDERSLSEYDVLILPHGYYGRSTFSAEWIAALKGWIDRGGTLVCFKGASRWAAEAELGLSGARLRKTAWPPGEGGEETGSRQTHGIPGAILRTLPDPHHYLTFGYEEQTPVLVASNLAFEPDPDIAAPFSFASLEEIRLAGFSYPDSLERLAETPYLVEERLGDGHIVLFLDDPNFRLYWRGLSRLFLNAILLSPSF
jgi:hypothetical protein